MINQLFKLENRKRKELISILSMQHLNKVANNIDKAKETHRMTVVEAYEAQQERERIR